MISRSLSATRAGHTERSPLALPPMPPATPSSPHPHEPPAGRILDGGLLSPEQVERVARGMAPVTLAPAAAKAIGASRAVVEAHLNDGHAHYGINTGFGSL